MGQRHLILFTLLAIGLGTGVLPGACGTAAARDWANSARDTLPQPDTSSLGVPGETRPPQTDLVSAGPSDTGTPRIVLPPLDSLRKIHSPRRAGLYSAVLPGLGQIYNHQFIKVPLMWGGLGVAAGIFLFDFNKYVTYRDAYRLRLNGHLTHDPRVDIYALDDLKYLRDGYRQYVDYSVLGFVAAYLYNILDAIVFAHLYHFDVSDDLSGLKFGPAFNPSGPYPVGLGFTYTFKK